MPDPAEMLQKLYLAGFDIQTLDRFPRSIGIIRGDCIALLEPDASAGLRLVGRPGWRIGDAIGALTTRGGISVFRWKDQVIEATPERLHIFQSFERELVELLMTERS